MDLLQGQNATFYVTFLDGSSAPINSGVSGTTIDIYHFSNSSIVIDVSGASMTQQAAPFQQVWKFDYTVPNNALTTSYNVMYTSIFSGSTLQGSEVYNVFPSTTTFPSALGQGNVSVSGTVVDPSGVGISGASVTVSSGVTVLASVATGMSGNYIVFLNSGTYLFTFQANGYFVVQENETVPPLVTEFNLGPVTLTPNFGGSAIISDQYAYKTPSQQIVFIPNLKVQLFANDNPAGNPPLGTAYTNASGIWVMTANPGHYVLTVEGEFFDQLNNKEKRVNQIFDIEVDTVWSGTGISGTGFPNNFQYLDTSKYNYLN